MHFGFVLELSDVDLWNIDLLDTHLDLLDLLIPSKYFVCIHSVFKTSSRHVFKTSSRHVLKTSSRRFQRNNFLSSKTSSKCLARCLQDVLEDVKLLRWRRAEEVFKTCLEDVFKTSSRPTNVCWVNFYLFKRRRQWLFWLFYLFYQFLNTKRFRVKN